MSYPKPYSIYLRWTIGSRGMGDKGFKATVLGLRWLQICDFSILGACFFWRLGDVARQDEN